MIDDLIAYQGRATPGLNDCSLAYVCVSVWNHLFLKDIGEPTSGMAIRNCQKVVAIILLDLHFARVGDIGV